MFQSICILVIFIHISKQIAALQTNTELQPKNRDDGNDDITFEPAHEIMILSVLRKFILQTGMRSHPVALDV